MTTNTTMDMSLNEGKTFIRLYHCHDCLVMEVQENPPDGRTQLFPLTVAEADALARGLDAVRAALRANWSVEEPVRGPDAVTAALKSLGAMFPEEKK